MWSFTWIIGLLCVTSCRGAVAVNSLKKRYTIGNEYEVVFDEEAIKNNSLVYGACKVDRFHEQMSCSIALLSFPDAKKLEELTCQSNYKAGKARQISRRFQLKKLFKNYVAFVWSDEEKLQSDVPKRHLVLSIINMDDCKNHDYDFKTQIDDFHIVAYEQSFDVYYHDERRCAEFLCGTTFDSRAKLINGPATSYLPSAYFNGQTHMCSVQSDSSAKGHFVMTPSYFNLVTANYGKRYEMGPIPFDARVTMYACNNDYLGYCWLQTNNKRIINCEQFDSKGQRTLSTGESFNYEPGTWMSMKNLGPSELLIVNNECNDENTCDRHTERVQFHVLKMKPDGKANDFYQFKGFECNNAKDIRSEVIKREDFKTCVTLACQTRNETGNRSINFFSTCFHE